MKASGLSAIWPTATRVDFVQQGESGECGLACLAMVASYYGFKTDLGTLRRRFRLSTRGSTLKHLIQIADEIGFHSRALKVEITSLKHVKLPAVLHWDLNHYVVLTAMRAGSKNTYAICDPARGLRTVDSDEFSRKFTGVVLELSPSQKFQRGADRSRLRLSQMWTKISGLGPALARILALSAVVQLIALSTPFYLQLAVDTALPAQDADLLSIIAIGFSGLLIISSLTSWVRTRLLLSMSNSIALQTAANLFRHTIFLPVGWFEKRHLGDVVSRFGSLQPVNDLLSRGLAGSVIDGILAMTTFAMMMIYSPSLAAIAAAVVALYVALKIGFFNVMKLTNSSVLNAQAMEASSFMESVRGIAAIKVFCQEGNRQRIWQNKKTELINMTVKLGRLTSTFDTASAVVVGLENIVFVYVAIKMSMAGTLSLGMIFAYQAYKQSFFGAAIRLVDQVQSYRLLDVHLSRISEIAFSTPEADEHVPQRETWKCIELRNVSFSYGHGLPMVLTNVNMEIRQGRETAIIGSSGSGKTTLMKIVCGLLHPVSGEMLIDGIPLHVYGTRRFRHQLGVVSQEDTLFAGSIAENVSFFDSEYAHEWVIECCRASAIHEDIEAMPLKYESLVGDMGSNLSGGQKQRVLLARALYKKPALLCLDESTAHLDVATEAKVAAAIRTLGITRLFVTHRTETIRSADRVFMIQNGRVTPIRQELADNQKPLLAAST